MVCNGTLIFSGIMDHHSTVAHWGLGAVVFRVWSKTKHSCVHWGVLPDWIWNVLRRVTSQTGRRHTWLHVDGCGIPFGAARVHHQFGDADGLILRLQHFNWSFWNDLLQRRKNKIKNKILNKCLSVLMCHTSIPFMRLWFSVLKHSIFWLGIISLLCPGLKKGNRKEPYQSRWHADCFDALHVLAHAHKWHYEEGQQADSSKEEPWQKIQGVGWGRERTELSSRTDPRGKKTNPLVKSDTLKRQTTRNSHFDRFRPEWGTPL